MEFLNLTPFGAAAYAAIDKQDREYDVVVVRVVYQLEPLEKNLGLGPTWFKAAVIDTDAPGLITEDIFEGEVGVSNLIIESDLAPYKPKCDVLVSGHAYAPGGKATTSWPIRLRVSAPFKPEPLPEPEAPQPLNPLMPLTENQNIQWQRERIAHRATSQDMGLAKDDALLRILLNKTLMVHGPRQFTRGLLGGWSLQSTEKTTRVPLTYALSYGGTSKVRNTQYPSHSEAKEFLIDEVCYANPIGCGWQHTQWERALNDAGQSPPDSVPAPQFEYADDPVRELDVRDQPAKLTVPQICEVAKGYPHQSAGFGPVGRSWAQRVEYTGTYNQEWINERWPNLPKDFDFAYWNCAPSDQQIAYLPPNAVIELGHLTDPSLTPSGYLITELPGHRAAVLFRLKSGLMIAAEPVIDTLHIDTDKLQIAVVWRAALSREMNAEVAEARFEVNPEKPLFHFERTPEADTTNSLDEFDPLATQPMSVYAPQAHKLGATHG
jgi:hypothetical protein